MTSDFASLPSSGVGADGPLTNTELLKRVRADPAASGFLFYERYQSLVRGVVYRLMGADSDQHEVVQQVFCELFASGFQLREPESLPGWVRSFTVCSVYRELRRRRSRRAREQASVTLGTRDLAREVEARDLLTRATRMIERLPRVERDVFTMRVVEGRTSQEMAELTGCSIATVKRRLARANARMLVMVARNAELMKLTRVRAA